MSANDSFCCYKCGVDLGIKAGTVIGRGESCGNCRADIRVCKNCRHFDPKAYNECRETSADRVLDKEKANFCDFFSPRSGSSSGAAAVVDELAEAQRRLDDLFK